MKVEFLKEDLTEFGKVCFGGAFSTTYEPNEIFMKLQLFHASCIGKINCVNLLDGSIYYIPTNKIVIRRKAKIIVE